MRKSTISMAVAVAAGVLVVPAASALDIYKDGDKYAKIGGRLQAQYHATDEKGKPTTDEYIFRRARLDVEVGIDKNWSGKVEWEMGKAVDTDELSLKSTYIQYSGIENIDLQIGNVKFPFSREVLTSSRVLNTVERTFVGDNKYGTPEYNMGLHFKGKNADKTLTWGAAAANATLKPDNKRLNFNTPVNLEKNSNEGLMLGGRVEYHPNGEVKMSQGDFEGKTKYSFAIAAFNWNNDGDVNKSTDTSKADVDNVTGLELGATLRMSGLSVDAQYNSFDAETVLPGISGGIYKNGETTLKNTAIKAGYMVMPSTLELVAGYETQDADGYADAWNRTSVGANWYVNEHKTKFQLTYTMGDNKDGVKGSDQDDLYLQASLFF